MGVKTLLAVALLAVTPVASGAPPLQESPRLITPERLLTPGINLDALRIEDAKREAEGLAPRFAKPFPVSITPDGAGRWAPRVDGSLRWTLEIRSPEAESINLGFTRFHLPAGAHLRIIAADGLEALAFDDSDNDAHRQLWTPVVQGDALTLELTLPREMRPFLELELGSVNHGYRGFGALNKDKSGSCNVDVVCSEGDEWRDEIRSVAVISTGGSTFCTGFLVNNTAQDLTPYFMTAYHCGIRESVAPSLVAYWDFETSTCGGPRDGVLGANNSGARLLAEGSSSDFTLVELDDPIDDSVDVHYAGWSAEDVAPPMAVGIHHPSTDEKAISFENDPTSITGYLNTASPGDGTHLMVEDWDIGTTEPGSSGSPLFDDNHRVVGQLHGGYAACGNDDADWYGRVSVSWAAGLGAHLDNAGTGALVVDGRDQCVPPEVAVTITPNPAVVGEAVSFSAQALGGEAPYSYSWDLDGDGMEDCSDETCTFTYKAYYNDNVTVTVSDSQPCSTSVTRALAVDGPRVDLASAGELTPTCDDGDSVFDAGETWSLPLTLENSGSQVATGVMAQLSTQGSTAPNLSLGEALISFGDIAPGESVTRVVDLEALADEANCQAIAALALEEVLWDGGSVGSATTLAEVAIGGLDGQDAIFMERFDEAKAFSDWTVTTGPGPHNAGEWALSTAERSRPTGSEGTYALTDSDAPGSGTLTSSALESPGVDLSNVLVGPIYLEADLFFRLYGGSEIGTVEAFDGTDWIILEEFFEETKERVSYDVTDLAAGNGDFRFRFNYQEATYDWFYGVDNVAVMVPTFAECEVVEDCGGDPTPTPDPTPEPTPTPTPVTPGFIVQTLTPPADLSVKAGETLGPIEVTWENPGGTLADFTVTTSLQGPTGSAVVDDLGGFSMGAGDSATQTFELLILRRMRPGTYTYGVQVSEAGEITNEDSFEFTVTRR